MRHTSLLAPILVSGLIVFSCAQGTNLDSEVDESAGSGPGNGAQTSSGAGSTSGATSSSGAGSTSGAGSSTSGAGSSTSGATSTSSGAGGASGAGAGPGSGGAGSGVGGAVGAGGAGAGSGAGGGGLGCVVVNQPFSNCPANFTSSGVNNDWQCGAPSGAAGPPGDHTTGNGSLWGTNISGKTANCEDAELVSPIVDLSPYVGKTVLLSFWHWFDFRSCTPNGILCPQFACQLDNSSYSGGIVEVTSGAGWVQVNPMGGYGNGGQIIACSDADAACTTCGLDGKTGFSSAGMEGVWQQSVFDVSAYASATSKVRFRYASHDAYSCYPKTGGWYIDDLEVKTLEPCP